MAALAVAVALLLAAIGGLAASTGGESVPSTAHVASGDLADLHAAGYTGENVSIVATPPRSTW